MRTEAEAMGHFLTLTSYLLLTSYLEVGTEAEAMWDAQVGAQAGEEPLDAELACK